MAKRRKGLKGSFKSKRAANRRTYTSVSSGSPVTKAVPRACAIVQSGAKKGKLRKGCRIAGNGTARCDELTRLPRTAKQRTGTKNGRAKYRTVNCPS